MKNKLTLLFNRWRHDYAFRTWLGAAMSTLATAIFALYNGLLWFAEGHVWSLSIAVYYLCLVAVRVTVLLPMRTERKLAPELKERRRRNIYAVTHGMLLFLNLALVVPLAVMVKGGRESALGLTPAIVMAAYTTWRLTTSILHARKARRQENILLAELRRVNLIDALVAVLSLQNTLIRATSGSPEEMLPLTAWTSGGILLLILTLTVISFLRIRKK